MDKNQQILLDALVDEIIRDEESWCRYCSMYGVEREINDFYICKCRDYLERRIQSGRCADKATMLAELYWGILFDPAFMEG